MYQLLVSVAHISEVHNVPLMQRRYYLVQLICRQEMWFAYAEVVCADSANLEVAIADIQTRWQSPAAWIGANIYVKWAAKYCVSYISMCTSCT